MNEQEEKIIQSILDHTYLNDDQKRRYIAAFLLMGTEKQTEFGYLWQKVEGRTQKVEQGDFLLSEQEQGKLSALFEGIKQRLFLKINSNLA